MRTAELLPLQNEGNRVLARKPRKGNLVLKYSATRRAVKFVPTSLSLERWRLT